jgi:uncharacterized protein YndB with AHSA1/START domain
MIVTAALIVAALIVAILVYAATKPSTFRYERSAAIKAAPEAIYPLINDLRSHGSWNPFDQDPDTKRHFDGAPSGKGSVYEWEGDRKAGAGRIEITESVPASRVQMTLDMKRPMACHNTVEFTLRPQAGVTNVTWALYGPQPYMAKLMGTFINCDKMCGSQFELGLANLKQIAEQRGAERLAG